MFQPIRITAAALASLIAVPAVAQDSKVDALYAALAMTDIVDIMCAEGVDYGAQIGTDLFPGRVNGSWIATVSDIYDAEAMHARVRAAFEASLEGDDLDAMLAFFTTAPGRDLVALEVSARRALLDDAVDAASKEAAKMAEADNTDRFQKLQEFVEVNDLIETNVVGALNSNYAFYTGLMDGGAFDGALTEDQILSDVWDQEDDIRANTSEWVYSFLLLAYDPVSDADLAAYTAFSRSDAGEVMNATLFESFDDMFDDISFALGSEAAKFMAGQDL